MRGGAGEQASAAVRAIGGACVERVRAAWLPNASERHELESVMNVTKVLDCVGTTS